MDKVGVGIDVGTCRSCVGLFKDNKASSILKSISFGRWYDDPMESPSESDKRRGVSSSDSPEEFLGLQLGKARKAAESNIMCSVKNAAMAIPASLNNFQREAIRKAAVRAGLEVSFITSTQAAGVAYAFERCSEVELTIFVLEIGGGSCHASVMTISDDVVMEKASAEDRNLRGSYVDSALCQYFVDKIHHDSGKDLRMDRSAIKCITNACECIKRTLSSDFRVDFPIKLGEDNLVLSLTRSEFDRLCAEFFERVAALITSTLEICGMKDCDIDEVILIGGSSKIPKLRSMVSDFFGKRKIRAAQKTEDLVAHGAAMQAAIKAKNPAVEKYLLIGVTHFRIEVQTARGLLVFPRGSTIPTGKTGFYVMDQDGCVLIRAFRTWGPKEEPNSIRSPYAEIRLPICWHGPGQVEVLVRVDIDSSGMLSATALQVFSQADIGALAR